MATVPYAALLDALERAPTELHADDVVVAFRTIGAVTVADVKPGAHEDALYAKKDFQRAVPRGMAFFYIDNALVHVLHGLTKFGNFGDFHDTKRVARLARANSAPEPVHVFYTKENGQCGHVSGFIHDDVRYLVVGSKNVHMALRLTHLDEDLAACSEPCYMFATKIARELLRQNYDLVKIVEYCHSTRHTLCAEVHLNEHQHLVAYGDAARFFFFAVTARRGAKRATTDAVAHPIDLHQTFGMLGLPAVSETRVAVTAADKAAAARHFATADNCEGAVVVVLQQQPGPRSRFDVVARYKLKNPQYVIWRAVRELLKRDAVTLETVAARLDALAAKHPEVRAHVSDAQLQAYHDEAKRFVAYMLSLGAAARAGLADRWVTHRANFAALGTAAQDALLARHVSAPPSPGHGAGAGAAVHVVMLVGFVGSGKSTLAAALAQSLGCRFLEQDQFAGSAARYHRAITAELRNADTTWLCLSKSHHDLGTRARVFDALAASGRAYTVTVLVLVAFVGGPRAMETETDAETDRETDPDPDPALFYDAAATTELCIARAIARGNAHATLVNTSAAELRAIVTKTFAQRFVFPSARESPHIAAIHTLDIAAPLEDVFGSACAALGLPALPAETVHAILGGIAARNELLRARNTKPSKPETAKPHAELPVPPQPRPRLRPVLYDCLALDPSLQLLELLREHGVATALPPSLVVQRTPRHVTLAFHGGKAEADAGPFDSGVRYSVHVTEVRWNAKACAVAVSFADAAAAALYRTPERHPHITVALADGVPPAYSAELFTTSEDNVAVEPLGTSVVLDGTTQRVFRNFSK